MTSIFVMVVLTLCMLACASVISLSLDFSKVSSVLGFNAIYDIDYGIKEIIEANKQKLFNDFLAKSNKYGNYTIEE